MKQKTYIVANWKAHFSLSEVRKWLESFIDELTTPDLQKLSEQEAISIIICPPSPFILPVKQRLADYPFIYMGSQDISTSPEGAYTGEVPASSLVNLTEYAIIGHSERRRHQQETEMVIEKKIEQANKQGIKTILCISNTQEIIYPTVSFVSYEPLESIGTGNNTSAKDVLTVKKQFIIPSHISFLYGGSVDEKNCGEYFNESEIDGVLVGNASLNPHSFAAIIRTAQQTLNT